MAYHTFKSDVSFLGGPPNPNICIRLSLNGKTVVPTQQRPNRMLIADRTTRLP